MIAVKCLYSTFALLLCYISNPYLPIAWLSIQLRGAIRAYLMFSPRRQSLNTPKALLAAKTAYLHRPIKTPALAALLHDFRPKKVLLCNGTSQHHDLYPWSPSCDQGDSLHLPSDLIGRAQHEFRSTPPVFACGPVV